MERQELIRQMKMSTKTLFITRQELAEVMGYKDPHNVDKYLNGLEQVGKRYFIPDIASVLKSRATV